MFFFLVCIYIVFQSTVAVVLLQIDKETPRGGGLKVELVHQSGSEKKVSGVSLYEVNQRDYRTEWAPHP